MYFMNGFAAKQVFVLAYFYRALIFILHSVDLYSQKTKAFLRELSIIKENKKINPVFVLANF